MPDEIMEEDGRSLVVVGLYWTRTEAYDRSLVVAAMGMPHWVLKREGMFALCVEPGRAGEAIEELRRFEAEGGGEKVTTPEPELEAAPHSTISLYAFVWIMGGFYSIQVAGPKWWLDRGTASSREIMQGQWWETFTALTLHGDLGHIVANVVTGLVYAGFLLPLLGAGWTWMFIVMAGGIGNWLNAWGHRSEEHLSIGASTAVFAALGMLMAAQCTLRALAVRRIRLREFLVPVGAGLGLLAYLGVGEPQQQVDYTAHLFGLLAGVPLGVAGIWWRLGTRTPRWAQALLAWAALGLVGVCWWLAAKRG
jgi:membrane associated rhomboid family serine protease